MLKQHETIRQVLVAQVVDRLKEEKQLSTDQEKLFEQFVVRYYEWVSNEDLSLLSVAKASAIVWSHWTLVQQRARGQVNLHLFNYFNEQRESATTVIQMTCDDMPFLVDSICMKLNSLDYEIQLIIHFGGLRVVRDDHNQIIRILSLGIQDNIATEDAVLYIEIDHQLNDAQLAVLETQLRKVLLHVHCAVADWSFMRQRLQESLAELEHAHLKLDAHALSETKDFLRWLDEGNFIFLGCRDYVLIGQEQDAALKIINGSGLGVLADETHSKQIRRYADMPEEARRQALSNQVLILAKTNTVATVHRPVRTDYIGIKKFNHQGKLIGERRFVGLYTSAAYRTNPKNIPFLRDKITHIMALSRLSVNGHAWKALLNIIETLPRDDLFQASAEELLPLCMDILQIYERKQVRLFVRQDAYNRFYSCLIFVPRERYNTDMRYEFERVLQQAFHAIEISFATIFGESVLAQIHFIVRIDSKMVRSIDIKAIEQKIIHAARLWRDDLRDELLSQHKKIFALALYQKYQKAFPASYQEYYTANIAVNDIHHIEKLVNNHGVEMALHIKSCENNACILHLKLFSISGSMPLSDVLPILENFGLRVLGEHPHKINLSDHNIWINEFDMICYDAQELAINVIEDIFKDAFTYVWQHRVANDGFNKLVLRAQLTWRQISVLRAFAKYLRQIGFTFSQHYIESALINHAALAKQLVRLFELRFDPTNRVNPEVIEDLRTQLVSALDNVKNLDEDRIIRRYLHIIFAILRTNFYQRDEQGQFKEYFSFKFNPTMVPELPLPRPMYEIFVYSPRVEGVHLRSAKVARGGLRWSDRHEDFRTEILGLMKAQQVKNAVIVPAGAKGGFVVKQLPEGSREEIMKEVVACYQLFICGLLDLTDNIRNGEVICVADTVCYDDSDPYLVVAADKGTATFSDYANQLAAKYQFWLGDAFASGGSAGYDHKKIAITARGAWISVRRNFAELGLDTQTTAFTVVGIGDMSGDVFGNGMLQSDCIKLVAAFNHQHIFIDPYPDPKISFKERHRLFNLPRSSWSDYDTRLISAGGGVFHRSEKSIKISAAMKAVFAIDQDALEPNELIRVLLKAPVDLIYNGGIGTYVKAAQETHLAVGDRANDGLRVNGYELRCRVFGEGGNLGCTQQGRVEYALQGGQIYADFIDNSGGVDCSDHEVNIKILLNRIMSDGKLSKEQRDTLLVEMTDDVAQLVLNNNDEQTLAVSVATVHSLREINMYRRYVNTLVAEGKFNRQLEFFADDAALIERRLANKGLTKSEIAILFAYTKNLLKHDLLLSTVTDDQFFLSYLSAEFPSIIQQRFTDEMKAHSLRREIIATQLTNHVVNRAGIIFIYKIKQETGASASEIVRAYAIASNLFDTEKLFTEITTPVNHIDANIQLQLLFDVSLLMQRITRWFIKNRHPLADIQSIIDHFKAPLTALIEYLKDNVSKNQESGHHQLVENYVSNNVPYDLARELAILPLLPFGLEIVDAAIAHRFPLAKFSAVFFELGLRMELELLRQKIYAYSSDNYWEELSRTSLLDDLDWQQRQLSINVMQYASVNDSAMQQIDEWFAANDELMRHWGELLTLLKADDEADLIKFSVAVRELTQFTQYSRQAGTKASVTQDT